MPACNHQSLGLPVHEFASIEDYASHDDLSAGLRCIGLPDGNHLDIAYGADLTQGGLEATPVFFNGALSGRDGTAPPYLSGLGVGSRLGIPVVAVADPMFNVDAGLNLAWYAGRAHERLQDAVTTVLWSLAHRLGRLLLVGGSGGGFASLFQAERLGDVASAFVWNPQTDLLLYAPPTVRAYLAAALDDASWLDAAGYRHDAARAALAEAGITNRVERLGDSRAALVIQNADDWHVDVHAKPLAARSGLELRHAGAWADTSEQHVLAFSHYGEGHAPAPSTVIEYAVREMSAGAAPMTVYRDLLRLGLLPSEDFEVPTATDGQVPLDEAAMTFQGHQLRALGRPGEAEHDHVVARGESPERILLEELVAWLAPGQLVVRLTTGPAMGALCLAASQQARAMVFTGSTDGGDALRASVAANDLGRRVLVEPLSDAPLDDIKLPPVRVLCVHLGAGSVQALDGARRTVDTDRPLVVCEAPSTTAAEQLDDFAAELGYTYIGRFAPSTYLLLPSRPGREQARASRWFAERLSTTNLLARDLAWRVSTLRDQLGSAS